MGLRPYGERGRVSVNEMRKYCLIDGKAKANGFNDWPIMLYAARNIIRRQVIRFVKNFHLIVLTNIPLMLLD